MTTPPHQNQARPKYQPQKRNSSGSGPQAEPQMPIDRTLQLHMETFLPFQGLEMKKWWPEGEGDFGPSKVVDGRRGTSVSVGLVRYPLTIWVSTLG